MIAANAPQFMDATTSLQLISLVAYEITTKEFWIGLMMIVIFSIRNRRAMTTNEV